MVAAPSIRILLTEDVVTDAELEVRELKRAGLRFSHRVATDEDSFRAELGGFAPDLILSDFSMPGFDGMAALAIAREEAPEVPFIFVSGTIGEEYAIRALKNGATDYVLKTNLVRLPAAVERALEESAARRSRRKIELELEIVRERLTSIFNSLQDALWSVSFPDQHVVYMSPAARQVFGREPDEFFGGSNVWLEVVHPEDRPRMLEAWERMLESGTYDVEYRAVHQDGGVRWVHDRGGLVRRPDGEPERADGIARDVTDAHQQRERIARLSRIRALLGAINAAIVRVRDRRELFDEFCRIAVAQGGFMLARALELDTAGKASIAATTESDRSLYQMMVDRYNADPQGDPSLLSRALRSGEVVYSNDVARDERIENRTELAVEGTYSLALLPTVVDERVAGVVVLRAAEPDFFDHEELRLLKEMVSNISFALELIDKKERLDFLALHDPLTGLPNRTLLGDRLGQALEAARRKNDRVALLVLDLERFRAINETQGRRVGDKILRKVARRLRETAADANHVARLGADQFALMLPAVREAAEVVRGVGEAAPRFLEAPFEVDGKEYRLAAKAGIAMFPEDGRDADALFRNAEATLKRAKETGERYLFYAPQINSQVAEQVELEHRLRQAVERGEFFLHYQPKIDLGTRRMVGLEALMRWKGPEGVQVSPARFVPVLEQTGLILEAGRQIIALASGTFRRWSAAGLNPPRIAVNLSAVQLRRKSFVEDVRAALGAPYDGGGVDLEVTESLLMADVDENIRKLRQLRDLGMHIALDDFGTGFSSLAYLSKLPLDALKIDRSFVHGMTERPDDTSIVTTIILLAQALRLKVIAEGVETEQQAQLLRLLRCDQMQGYLVSPPVPPERIEQMIADAARAG